MSSTSETPQGHTEETECLEGNSQIMQKKRSKRDTTQQSLQTMFVHQEQPDNTDGNDNGNGVSEMDKDERDHGGIALLNPEELQIEL